MGTLYWHDYETFGADPARDRPAQFAGIRTDPELRELDEPLVLFCRPAPDYLPHPDACLITGITPKRALAEGSCEAVFIGRIHEQLARPGTCGVGYNSIRFDDEFTRYTLYRNFYDPYAREWRDGNSRWDLIDVMRMAFAFRPDGIEWPLDRGVPTFRLERLTAANGIEHAGAHDALADVRATIALARLLRARQPRLYAYAFSLRRKREVLKQLDLSDPKPVLHVSSRFPAARACTALVLPLLQQPDNGNAIVVWDLASDPAPLFELSVDEIRRRVFSTRAELGEGVERLPLKSVHSNRSPMLAPPAVLDEDGFRRIGIDYRSCMQHAERLIARGAAVSAKLQALYGGGFDQDDDPDTQLYSGFFGDGDRKQMQRVRAAGPDRLAQWQPSFDDPRLPELLFRYRARNFPASLSADEAQRWERWRLARLQASWPGGLDGYCRELAGRARTAGAGSREAVILRELIEYARTLKGPGDRRQ